MLRSSLWLEPSESHSFEGDNVLRMIDNELCCPRCGKLTMKKQIVITGVESNFFAICYNKGSLGVTKPRPKAQSFGDLSRHLHINGKLLVLKLIILGTDSHYFAIIVLKKCTLYYDGQDDAGQFHMYGTDLKAMANVVQQGHHVNYILYEKEEDGGTE
jgi:hypothetical protein